MIASWGNYFHQVSWGLDKKCGFFSNGQFFNVGPFLTQTLHTYLPWMIFHEPHRILKVFFVFSFSRQKQDEVMKLESQIRYKAEEQRKAGQELDSTCQICLKTKFADGIGHICNYCNVRCCARCGGKVALRSSKVRFMFKVNSEMESITYHNYSAAHIRITKTTFM